MPKYIEDILAVVGAVMMLVLFPVLSAAIVGLFILVWGFGKLSAYSKTGTIGAQVVRGILAGLFGR